jgi:hypothetical protein
MADADRLRESLTAIIDALLPQVLYLAVWPYRVQAVEAGPPVRISARSQDERLPDVVQIELRPDSTGGYATPVVGAEVLIGFVGGDPSRPYVHSLDPHTRPATTTIPATTTVALGYGTQTPVALATSALITWLSTHTHKGVTTGNGVSGSPVTTPPTFAAARVTGT